MQINRKKQTRTQGNGQATPRSGGGRAAPQDMPRDIPAQSRIPKQQAKPQDVLPQQKPVTDEVVVEVKQAKWKKVLKRVGTIILIVVALAMAYLFLLLGEPENAVVEDATQIKEEAISVPMAGVEMPGGGDLSVMAATFGKPVLALYGGAELQKATLYDTAFQGGYARRATLTYVLEDGQILTVESVRPTAAAALLTGGSHTSLDWSSIYNIAGFDAARMKTSDEIYIIASSGEAVYALRCPASHAADVSAFLKQTTLLQPQVGE